jgi:putative PEP-CTERM system TPR-repeat lipoprotein
MLASDTDQATTHLETALDLSPQFQQADLLLVLNQLEQGNIEAAANAAESYRRRNPTAPTPYNLLGRVLLLDGQEEKARESFTKALSLSPGDPTANLNLARMDLAAGDRISARRRCEDSLEHHPKSLPIQLQLARMDFTDDDEAAAINRLLLTTRNHPSALEPRLMLGHHYLSTGRANQVAALFSTLDPLQQRAPQVLQLMALAQLGQNQTREAQLTAQRLQDAAPDTAASHYIAAMAAIANGNKSKTRSEITNALAREENHIPSLVLAAKLALSDRSLDEFQTYVVKLEGLAPNAPETLRLRATQARITGDTAELNSLADYALNNSSGSQQILELASYMRELGMTTESSQLMEQWLKQHPDDTDAHLALAETLINQGAIGDAMSHYHQILALNPDNLTALNNLAWFLRLDRPEQALSYITRAASIAPDRPEVLDTMGVINHLGGDHLLALRQLERAHAARPEEPSISYHLAMVHVALGNRSAARAILKEVIPPEAEDFPEKKAAESLYLGLTQD